jgi:hypothetical protein
MPQPYRLTVYLDGIIDRMLPFDSLDVAGAVAFADSQRYGRHAELSDRQGLVKLFPADAMKEMAARLRRPAPSPS